MCVGVYTTTLVLGYTAKVFFVRSGYVYPSRYLSYAGTNGYYWSSVASSLAYVYYLHLRSSSVDPSASYGSKCTGQSVRCVAPSA